jgi:large subunit ribosomal protein L3
MVGGFYGRKIGMTQLFSENQVIPVTIIDASFWFVTDIKTKERDGYYAVQLAKVRKRYEGEAFHLSG